MRFIHQFSRRIICEVTVSDEPPPKGTVNSLKYEWTEFPDRRFLKKFLAEYRQWILEVNRVCADRWNQRILYGIEIAPDKWEFWGFAPGEPPKRVDQEEVTR